MAGSDMARASFVPFPLVWSFTEALAKVKAFRAKASRRSKEACAPGLRDRQGLSRSDPVGQQL
ncbi:hypothetical protein ATO3_08700 [Marinibacterium profundimaris]|uniref:Uncharacterized protein n=1 Tax=Marinibacterium profundimaris TaxID=1679460 RepID=A0A225NKG3_9RHOB|nr:hypothetical protein ATO3_08700 [Marinibacterium profundimaris]